MKSLARAVAVSLKTFVTYKTYKEGSSFALDSSSARHFRTTEKHKDYHLDTVLAVCNASHFGYDYYSLCGSGIGAGQHYLWKGEAHRCGTTGFECERSMCNSLCAFVQIRITNLWIKVTNSASFGQDLGADSLSLVELVLALEEVYYSSRAEVCYIN